MKRIILQHVLLFLVFTGIFVLSSEWILNLLLPDLIRLNTGSF
ncbi:MAG TPA: hypothetical protein PLD17_04685 [Flavobacteriales bacterium]|nr:hypothetical protein [Flavobacteriales bacterium]